MKFCTVILHPKGLLRAQRHQNHLTGCEKRSQNWPKNGEKHIFSTLYDFLKNCPYDLNEIFYSIFTLFQGPICAMASKLYGWDAKNMAKISPKMV